MLWWDDNAAKNNGSEGLPVFMEAEDSELVSCYRSMGAVPIPRKISLGGRKSDLPNVDLFKQNISHNSSLPSKRKVSAPSLTTAPTIKAYNPLPRRKISCPIASFVKPSEDKTNHPPNQRKISYPNAALPAVKVEKEETMKINRKHDLVFSIESISPINDEFEVLDKPTLKTKNEIIIKSIPKIKKEFKEMIKPTTEIKKESITQFTDKFNETDKPATEIKKESISKQKNEFKEKVKLTPEVKEESINQIKDTFKETDKPIPVIISQLNEEFKEDDIPTAVIMKEIVSQLTEEFKEEDMSAPKIKMEAISDLNEEFKEKDTSTLEIKKEVIGQVINEIKEVVTDLHFEIKLHKAKCGLAIKSEAIKKAVVFKQKVVRDKIKCEMAVIKEELKRGSMKDKWGLKLVYQMSQEGGLCLAVLKVTSFTAGHKAKLQPGDHIITINDWQIDSMDQPQVVANLFRAAGFSVVLGLERSNLVLDQWTLLDDF